MHMMQHPFSKVLFFREVVQEVAHPSSLVKDFFRDMELLAGHSTSVKQGYIKAFLRSLQYQALAVITWTQHNKWDNQF